MVMAQLHNVETLKLNLKNGFNQNTKFNYEQLSNDRLGLLTIAKPCIQLHLLNLEQALPKINNQYDVSAFTTEIAINAFLPCLIQRLKLVITRTMILELNVARLNNDLIGENSEQRFHSFVTKLQNLDFVLLLLTEYPVLSQCIDETVKQWKQYCLETLSRLQRDYSSIVEVLGHKVSDVGQLDKVLGDQGDCHNNGRSVAIIQFSSGFKVVYKPRGLDLDIAFHGLIRWIDQQGRDQNFNTFKVINCKNYGWCEFVEPKSLSRVEDAQQYYYNFGCLVAVMYFLGATDIHFENIIAHGFYPTVIDLETFFFSQTANAEPYNMLLTGLLPQRLWFSDKSKGVDVGALSANVHADIKIKGYRPSNKISDEMIWHGAAIYQAKANNIPVCKNTQIPFETYISNIISGYTEIYNLLSKSKCRLFSDTKYLHEMLALKCRYIARSTPFYCQLLDSSYHPDLLRNFEKRNSFLRDNLLKDSKGKSNKQQLESELSCLEDNNIPIFYSHADTAHLYDLQKTITNNYFVSSAKDEFLARVTSLSETQLKAHCSLLTQVLTQNTTQKLNNNFINNLPKWPTRFGTSQVPEALLSASQSIGNHLIDNAIVTTKDVSWFGYHIAGDDRVLGEVSLDFYAGRLGPIMFLAYLSELSGEVRYKKLAHKSLNGLVHRLKSGSTYTGTGFSGWGGYLYVLASLYSIWRTDELTVYIDDALAQIKPLILDDKNFDIVAGNAGCILALLTLAKHSRYKQTATTLAKLCGDALLATTHSDAESFGWPFHQCDRVLTGFGHGNSGVALALDQLYQESKNTKYLMAAQKAIAFENSLYNDKEKNWPDLRDKNNKKFMSAWCHGAAGITLSRSLIKSPDNEDFHQRDMQIGIEQLQKKQAHINQNLCHGVLGNLDILHTASIRSNNPKLANVFTEKLAEITKYFNQKVLFAPAEPLHQQPGFMTGLSGMGYVLLKVIAPELLPNALALSPPLTNHSFESYAGLSE